MIHQFRLARKDTGAPLLSFHSDSLLRAYKVLLDNDQDHQLRLEYFSPHLNTWIDPEELLYGN